MNPDWKMRATNWSARIAKLARLESPDTIMAHAVASFFRVAMAHLGGMLMEQIVAWVIADSKRHAGLCTAPGCANGIKNYQQDMPLCDACHARGVAQDFTWLMEQEEDPPYEEEEGPGQEIAPP